FVFGADQLLFHSIQLAFGVRGIERQKQVAGLYGLTFFDVDLLDDRRELRLDGAWIDRLDLPVCRCRGAEVLTSSSRPRHDGRPVPAGTSGRYKHEHGNAGDEKNEPNGFGHRLILPPRWVIGAVSL